MTLQPVIVPALLPPAIVRRIFLVAAVGRECRRILAIIGTGTGSWGRACWIKDIWRCQAVPEILHNCSTTPGCGRAPGEGGGPVSQMVAHEPRRPESLAGQWVRLRNQGGRSVARLVQHPKVFLCVEDLL